MEQSNLTYEKLKQIIEDIDFKNKTNDSIQIYQSCKTVGIVKRSSNNLNICSNPNCHNCREWIETLKETLKNEIKNYGV